MNAEHRDLQWCALEWLVRERGCNVSALEFALRDARVTVDVLGITNASKALAIEVKASRADLLSDLRAEKPQSILGTVAQLYYLVSGPEVCVPDDLPVGVGLLRRNGESCVVVKRAKGFAAWPEEDAKKAAQLIARKWTWASISGGQRPDVATLRKVEDLRRERDQAARSLAAVQAMRYEYRMLCEWVDKMCGDGASALLSLEARKRQDMIGGNAPDTDVVDVAPLVEAMAPLTKEAGRRDAICFRKCEVRKVDKQKLRRSYRSWREFPIWCKDDCPFQEELFGRPVDWPAH